MVLCVSLFIALSVLQLKVGLLDFTAGKLNFNAALSSRYPIKRIKSWSVWNENQLYL